MMRGRAVDDPVIPKVPLSRTIIALPRPVLRWGAAALIALGVLLLLPHYRPAATVTYTAAELTTVREANGFYPPESDTLGNQYVWANSDAIAGFDFASRKPLAITVTLRSAATAGGPDAPVHVLVDDHEVASVHPGPRQYDFQPYQVRVPRAPGPIVQVGLISMPFGPRPNDGRTLGVMVRAITIDRTEAWSTIARRTWLYWLVPIGAMLVLAGASLARRSRSAVIATLAGYEAIGAAAGSALAMLFATALLFSIGELDRSTYYLWLFGSAYLAVFAMAVALALPFGGPLSPSLGQRIVRAPFVRRHLPPIRLTGRVALFSATLLFALGFFTYYGTGDVDRKLKWMGNTQAYGLIEAYRRIPDQYPPFTLALLDAARYLENTLHVSDFAAFKLSLTVFFALTGAAFLWWRRDLLLTAALLVALLPNTLALGYTDIYFAPTLILTLAALRRRRFVAFSLLLAITCLIKWQAAILAPPLLLAAVRLATGGPKGQLPDRSAAPRRLAAIVLPGLVVSAGVLVIFGGAVFASLAHGFGEHFLSANALNAPWLLTQLLHAARPAVYGGLPVTEGRAAIETTDPRLTLVPKLVFAATYLFALIRLWRGVPTFATILRWSLAAYLAYFAFNTGVHENHLFTAVLVAAAFAAESGVWGRGVFAAVAIAANLNLLLFYGLRGTPRLPPVIFGPLDWSTVLAGINVGLVILYFAASVRNERRTARSLRSLRRP